VQPIRYIVVHTGVRGQSGFFNWALRERNIQVRLYLNKGLLTSQYIKLSRS
jgi:hypothetical protein